MPSFNVGKALESGYEPAEVLRYLAGKGVDDQRYAGLKDEEKIRRLLADTGGKVMLPYSYATQQMPAADIQNLYSQEQGITPELGLPMSLTDMVMEPAMSFLEEADVAKYLLPLGLLGMVKTRKPAASDLFHGTSSRNLRSMSEEGISPYGKAYVSPFPEIAKDVAHERVYGLNPSGDVLEGGVAAGGQPTLVVLDRNKLRDAGVKFERDPEMNWNRDNWRDIGGLMTTPESGSIPSDAIKRSYVGEKEIRKAIAEYGTLKKPLARKSGR